MGTMATDDYDACVYIDHGVIDCSYCRKPIIQGEEAYIIQGEMLHEQCTPPKQLGAKMTMGRWNRRHTDFLLYAISELNGGRLEPRSQLASLEQVRVVLEYYAEEKNYGGDVSLIDLDRGTMARGELARHEREWPKEE